MSEKVFRVLVVENKKEDCEKIRDLFNDYKFDNFEISLISDFGDDINLLIDEIDFDLYLINYNLQNKNGLDYARRILSRGRRKPIILLLDEEDKDLEREAIRAGATDLLIKSRITSKILERSMRYAIEFGRSETALINSEARFRSVVQNLSDIIVILDGDLKITYVSPSVEHLKNLKTAAINGRRFAEFIYPEDLARMLLFIESIRETDGKTSVIEWRTIAPDGEVYFLESTAVNLLNDPHVSGIVITSRNITKRKKIESALNAQVFYDPLTKLANRLLFRNRVEHASARLERQKSPLAVLFLDLDNFKVINESLGYEAGDNLLRKFSERLLQCVRTGDTVARMGGDEFAVLLEDIESAEAAIEITRRILECAGEPFELEDRKLRIGVSVGVAISRSSRKNTGSLLRNAEVAMYSAKESGKGAFAVYKRRTFKNVISQMELAIDFPRALDKGQFVLNYQPIICLESKRVIGFEALVRWNHEKFGLLAPGKFIALAEKTGFIIPLGKWIIEESCRQVKALSDTYGRAFTMTVNISGKQIQNPGFVDEVAAAVFEAEVDPGSIILEITESEIMLDTQTTIEYLNRLKSLGVRLAIDDFGTGYSSLNYLRQFPIDILKIDKSFISNINKGSGSSAVAKTILSLSDALRLSTIAEGIESADQIPALRELGCKYGQGFYFSKPLSADQISRIENLKIDFDPEKLIYPELTFVLNKKAAN